MTTARRHIPIHSPIGGVYRSTEYQKQPPYTTFDALNVWPYDAKTGREGCAVRPGYTFLTSPGGNANLLATLNVAPEEGFQRLFLAASGGTLKKYNGLTWEDALGNSITTGRNVQSTPFIQKLIIASDGTPQVYDYDTNTVADLVPSGSTPPPSDCQLVCTWENRIVFANQTNNPHLWFMSRIDDHADWDYDEGTVDTDKGMAVSGTDVSGGQLTEPITALTPHSNQCLLFHTAQSLFVMRGNPLQGGRLLPIGDTHGAINATAWCHGSGPPGVEASLDWVWMMTRDGLYVMHPGCGSPPYRVSRKRIPESLMGLDGINNKCFLAYDVRWRILHIYVEGTDRQAWHYDIDRGGFWPQTVPWNSMLAIHRHDPLETIDKSGVFVAGDGGLYYLNRNTSLEGSTRAYFDIGPIRIGSMMGWQSNVIEAAMVFSENTSAPNATIDLYGGPSAESVVSLPTDRKEATKFRYMGPAYTWHPRVGGHAAYLRFKQAQTSDHFAFEGGRLTLVSAGRVR